MANRKHPKSKREGKNKSRGRDRFIVACSSLLLMIGTHFSVAAQTQPQSVASNKNQTTNERLKFHALPDLPEAIGVAGPIVGLHRDTMIVAGGANFAAEQDPELWSVPKQYLDRVWILERDGVGSESAFRWRTDTESFRLPKRVGYPAVVDTDAGVLVMGGENEDGPTNHVYLISWEPNSTTQQPQPIFTDWGVADLPFPCTNAGAAVIENYVYLVGGQIPDEANVLQASRGVWRLRIDHLKGLREPQSRKVDVNDDPARWEQVASWPAAGPPRMFPLVTAQHDGFTNRLFVFGGRYFPENTDHDDPDNLTFLSDGWSFDPAAITPDKFDSKTGAYGEASPWTRLTDSPVPVTAGSAVPFGPAHVIVPAYASGDALKTFLATGTEMKDYAHPGFPREALAYHTITNTWTRFGPMPAGQVTTPACRWGQDIMLVSGEIRPRVRTAKVWRIEMLPQNNSFGAINLSVVGLYLLAMVGVGLYFMFRNSTTDEYFRGGSNVPWWAAGCSIFATMLSSITYMAIPAKSFAQDWVYALGNGLILAVAPIAVFVAMPFYRRLDVTSAYEYLEHRFNRKIRLIGSASFTLFHVFRMGVVLALAALALASVTQLTPAQCVIVMGVLSIIYCTIGGIEAVIWTDTLQTFVLLGGALLCLFVALNGADEGSFSAAIDAQKFHLVNVDFSTTSFTTLAIWVVVLGGMGQNVASYTADQAVVQRYLTTRNEHLAARSIWLNGLMAIPAALLFFGMGTAFWMFYRSHPEKLDPTIAADRIMPLFISQELPVGLAGLVVAGIFAAAQSTVSTSMNSGATTLVTDFLKPFDVLTTDRGYLWAARVITLLMGVLGTVAGLYFVDPTILSLFDQFIGILGMFLGVLAGLFALGATTKRANSTGSMIGAAVAMLLLISIVFAANDQAVFGFSCRGVYDAWGTKLYLVSGYLYAFIGISVCYVVGYLASLMMPATQKP